MGYSRQVCNGTVVENIDGEIFVNGVNVVSGRKTSSYLGNLIGAFLIGFIAGVLLSIYIVHA